MLSFLSFISAIALLVFVHEYGHYWAARRCGVGVLTFSIGFGKPLYQWQRGITTWQIAAIPLGGYVRMLDEAEAPVSAELRSQAFNTQHPLKKMAIAFAGPFANLLLATLLYAGFYAYGVTTLRPIVATLASDSIAAKAGVQQGDLVLRVEGEGVKSWDQAQLLMFSAAGQPDLTLEVSSKASAVRTLRLPLSSLSREEFDQYLLSRLGISPYASSAVIDVVQAKGGADGRQ